MGTIVLSVRSKDHVGRVYFEVPPAGGQYEVKVVLLGLGVEESLSASSLEEVANRVRKYLKVHLGGDFQIDESSPAVWTDGEKTFRRLISSGDGG